MAVNQKHNDPRLIPVQLNVMVPWAFREFLSKRADVEHVSLNKLVFDTLRREYGEAFDKSERPRSK